MVVDQENLDECLLPLCPETYSNKHEMIGLATYIIASYIIALKTKGVRITHSMKTHLCQVIGTPPPPSIVANPDKCYKFPVNISLDEPYNLDPFTK